MEPPREVYEHIARAIEPRKHPKGIMYVLVNGVPVVEKGKHIGAMPGRIIKRLK